jgi:hypothetical protein
VQSTWRIIPLSTAAPST